MKLLLIFGLLALLFGSFFLQNKQQDKFMTYRSEWGKSYNGEEEVYRRAIFEENAARIESHNATPGIEYTEAVNQFTDLTAEEFEQTYLGLLPADGVKENDSRSYVNAESIDWEKKGAVGPVKDQGSCGSCWAFSAVANLEVLNFLFGSKKMELFSEQQLVDCSKAQGNHGCQGGLMTYAYTYVKSKGIVKQDEYPYVARDQACKKDGGPFKIDGYTEIKSCDDQIEKLQKQTVAVAADASRWSSYSSGIFNNCGTRLNHGITLVGWNKEEGYWRIKNSWGTRWGEKGFMRLKYPGSTCGICDMSCIPYGPKWV